MRWTRLFLEQLVGRLRQLWRWRGRGDTFSIDLSSRYRPMIAPFRKLLMGTCAMLFLGILWNVGQSVAGYQEARTIAAELERVRQQDIKLITESQEEGIDLSDAALQRLPAEVDLANELLEKRTFSWTTFLTGLEQAIPSRLALSSVRLDQSGTTVHLTGAAISLEDITAFTVGLEDHPTFKDPVLAQHRMGSNGLVEFDITLHYNREGV